MSEAQISKEWPGTWPFSEEGKQKRDEFQAWLGGQQIPWKYAGSTIVVDERLYVHPGDVLAIFEDGNMQVLQND